MTEFQLTYHDLYSDLLDWGGSAADSSRARNIKRACKTAVRNLAMEHRWSYYRKIGRITTSTSYSTGTIEYTDSTRVMTLTGGTWPTWAASGFVRINNIDYPVYSRDSDTELTISVDANPSGNVSSGTAYAIYRSVYSMPTDFLSSSDFENFDNAFSAKYIAPGDLQKAMYSREAGSEPRFYTFIGDPDYIGGMAVKFYPAPGATAYNYDFVYMRHPANLNLLEYKTGTVSVAGGSTTVTGYSNTAWTSDMVGCVIRFTTESDYPDGPTGDNPAVEERIITAVADANTLTIDSAVENTYSQKKYRISSLVDIEPATMQTAVELGAERELASITRSDRIGQIDAVYRDAVIRAKEADHRHIGTSSGGRMADPNSLTDWRSGSDY